MNFSVPCILFFAFVTSCAEKGDAPKPNPVLPSENHGLHFFYSGDSVKFNAFNAEIPVIAFDSINTLNPCQQNAAAWFQNHQEEIFPELKRKIFEYYQSIYPDYEKKWRSTAKMNEREMERYLPYPAFPDSLLGHMKPYAFVVHTSKHCSDNSFSIEFDCTWDTENGMGVYVENGKVKFASIQRKTYPD